MEDNLAAIGIMGGTFDPIHIGHLILAQQAWETFGLGKVMFVTAADPPHKPERVVAPAGRRHEMVCLAVEGNEHFECSSIEIDRCGPSYTVDTLRRIAETHAADTRLYLLMGADEASDLMSWRDPYGILELATIAVANRPGCSVAEAIGCLPDDFGSRLIPLEMPGVDISSTDIRARVGSGRSMKYLVPEAVENYIARHGLYA